MLGNYAVAYQLLEKGYNNRDRVALYNTLRSPIDRNSTIAKTGIRKQEGYVG